MNKEISVYDNSISARTYLSYIAEQAGGIAIIGRDGKLYIKTFGESVVELSLNRFKDFKWGEKFKITRVYYEDGIQRFEQGDTTENTVYISQDNMYIVDQEQIDNIYDKVKNLEVYSFEGTTIIDPAIDVGDILLIDGKKVIYQGSSEYSGHFIASISSKIQCKAKEETTTRTTSQTAINRRVQSQINQAEGKITLLSSSVEKAVVEIKVLYALGDSATTAPTTGWSETAPEWQEGKYMWQKTATTNGVSTTYSEPTCIQGAKGEQGIQGEKGDTGIGVQAIEAQYYLSDSNTTQTGGSWKNTQDEWQSGKYYWTRSKITWTDDTVTYTESELAEALNNANNTANEALNNTTEANEKIAQLGIVDDEIKASVTKTETRLSNDFLTAEQVQALNDVNTADIELLKQQQTSASMTAEGLQLQINKIENDGVSKVKNTTVDITEEGVSIGKSDSEFSSTWNNTGTYFKSYGKNIAEYSKDGAIMEKATVKTQFRMLRLKFVERTINGEPRVQGFWKKGE